MDRELARQVREAAGDTPVSVWLADAARRRLASEKLLAVVGSWEREHGALGAEEIAAAATQQQAALAEVASRASQRGAAAAAPEAKGRRSRASVRSRRR